MKKYLLSFTDLLLSIYNLKAQVNYTFSTASGTFTPITGTTAPLSGGNTDDGWSNNIPLNFTLNYNGNLSVTQVHAGTNGYLALGSALTQADLTNDLTNGTLAGSRPFLAPLWDDI